MDECELKAIKIGELPAVSDVKDSDLFVLEQDGTAKKLAGSKLLEYFKGDKGDTGPAGPAGKDGTDGKDGVSPTVSFSEIAGGNRMTVTDAEGEKSVDIMNGKDGKDGDPGPAGQDGHPGERGEPGADGKDATINGRNAITILEGENVWFDQDGDTLTINATGEGGSGQPGPQGPPGESAGFGTISATVDDGVGVPSVDVETSGQNTALNISFSFHNLNGEPGRNATINGENAVELIEGENINITQDGDKVTISAIADAKFPDGGEPGQVLTLTREGVDWQDPPGSIGQYRFNVVGEDLVLNYTGDTPPDFSLNAEDGHLYYDKAQSFDLGKVVGPPGEKGDKGDDGKPGTTADIYSTTETKIGTWIDGKPLYRKVLSFRTPSRSDSVMFSQTGISIYNFYGYIYEEDDEVWSHFPGRYATEYGTNVNLNKNRDSLRFMSDPNEFYYVDLPVIFIIEYTKNSDVATSSIMEEIMDSISKNKRVSVKSAPVSASSATLDISVNAKE